jgi:hypothetical protein
MVFLQKWSELEEVNNCIMDHSNSGASNTPVYLIICEIPILTEQIIHGHKEKKILMLNVCMCTDCTTEYISVMEAPCINNDIWHNSISPAGTPISWGDPVSNLSLKTGYPS